jgi:hypothetical protein
MFPIIGARQPRGVNFTKARSRQLWYHEMLNRYWLVDAMNKDAMIDL